MTYISSDQYYRLTSVALNSFISINYNKNIISE